MKIFVVGATGRVGRELLSNLTERGHEVLAGARQPEKVLQDDKISPVKFDLTASPREMAERIAGVDAIIDVAGSSGGSLLQIDLFGTVNLMRAAEIAGVKRFVLLSTIFALQPEKWTTPGFIALKDYYIAKHFADVYLTENTGLDYSILQPGYLQELPATGKIAVNDDVSGAIPIPDVAASLAEIVTLPNTIGQVISLHAGSQDIASALRQI